MNVYCQIGANILNYNDITDRELVILGGTQLGEEHCAKHIELAFNKGCSF